MYKLLEDGEIVQEDDECFIMSDGGWKKVQSSGNEVSNGMFELMPVRRKIQEESPNSIDNNKSQKSLCHICATRQLGCGLRPETCFNYVAWFNDKGSGKSGVS